ncbi:hypothetical protein OG21DRAFT_1219629 [Imleria badia]|nr:hypothetical protein OG21DRAFT_1219629 [Imleria badia]
MVWLVGGYPIPYSDAKVWALRHWPDINIYDDLSLPVIISRYHKSRGGNVECIGVNLKEGPGLVEFPEGKLALRCKGLLFNHEDDKELAQKVQFMTVADPFQDYYKFRPLPEELKRKRAAASQENQDSAKPCS